MNNKYWGINKMTQEKKKIILHKDKNKIINMLTELFIETVNNEKHYEYAKTSSSNKKVLAKCLLVFVSAILLLYFAGEPNLSGILQSIIDISIIMSGIFSMFYLICVHLDDNTNEYLKLGYRYYETIKFNKFYTHGKKNISCMDERVMTVWINYAGLSDNYKAYNQLLNILHDERNEAYEEYHNRLQEVIKYSANAYADMKNEEDDDVIKTYKYVINLKCNDLAEYILDQIEQYNEEVDIFNQLNEKNILIEKEEKKMKAENILIEYERSKNN